MIEGINNMSKFEYTDDMVAAMHDVAGAGVTEATIESLMSDFDFPRRSVTAKLRKLGYDVPKKPGAAPVFSADETEAMNNQAIKMFEDEKLRPRAMAHLIHSIVAPRISDTAAFKWEYINFNQGIIQFRATKNCKICSQFIEERFIPIFLRYRNWVIQYERGDEYLFPTSILQSSGSKKRALPHATDKSIRKWLANIRDSTTLCGEMIQKLPSHSYRHSLAMRYLAKGCTFENIAMGLGDDVATIQKHYAELIPNDSQRLAF